MGMESIIKGKEAEEEEAVNERASTTFYVAIFLCAFLPKCKRIDLANHVIR
jgi:hypothetical protein